MFEKASMETFVLYDLDGDCKTEEEVSSFVICFDENEEVVAEEKATVCNIEEETRKAFEDAFVQGEKAGYEMGMKRTEPLIKRLGGIIAELSVFKEELVRRAERLSTELAFIFAEAIILRECREDHDTVMRMISKALSLCDERSGTTIRIKREDAAYISGDESSHFRIIKDDTIRESGFIIETNFGDIDGQISVQIEELKKEYLNGKTD